MNLEHGPERAAGLALPAHGQESGMKLLRAILLILGALAVLGGLVWIGQGTGYFPYPAGSFMIDQTPWAWRGLALAAVGVVMVVVSRRV
jgi:hypothetical protein